MSGVIAKSLKLIDVANLNGQDRPILYKPIGIVQKNVSIVITDDNYGNKVHKYSFKKEGNEHIANLSVSSTMEDGAEYTVVLGEVEEDTSFSISGKSYTLEAGKQKLMLKPADYKLAS